MGGEKSETEGFFKESKRRTGLRLGRLFIRQSSHAFVLRLWSMLQTIWGFIEQHNRLYVLTWALMLAVPVPILWTIFATCLGIPDHVIRPIAVWTFIFAMLFVWAIVDSVKKPGEKSALDNALTA